MTMSVAVAGLTDTLESVLFTLILINVLQVFDGHSGSDAANYAKENLHAFFADSLQPDSLLPDEMHEAMVSQGCSVHVASTEKVWISTAAAEKRMC